MHSHSVNFELPTLGSQGQPARRGAIALSIAVAAHVLLLALPGVQKPQRTLPPTLRVHFDAPVVPLSAPAQPPSSPASPPHPRSAPQPSPPITKAMPKTMPPAQRLDWQALAHDAMRTEAAKTKQQQDQRERFALPKTTTRAQTARRTQQESYRDVFGNQVVRIGKRCYWVQAPDPQAATLNAGIMLAMLDHSC